MKNKSYKNEMGKNVIISLLMTIIIMFTGVVLVLTLSANGNNDKEENGTEENIKIDNKKDYIYDAEYIYNNQKYQEYTRFDEAQYLKDLKVPFINIDSTDITKANKEIEELYMKYAKEFDECAESDINGGCFQELNYETHSYQKILSIVIKNRTSITSPEPFIYHTYVIDLENGKLLSYNETLNKLGYDKDKTLENIKSILKNDLDRIALEQQVNLSNSSSNCGEVTNCYDKSYELVENDINNDNILYLVDSNGKLNIYAVAYNELGQNSAREKNLYIIDK